MCGTNVYTDVGGGKYDSIFDIAINMMGGGGECRSCADREELVFTSCSAQRLWATLC